MKKSILKNWILLFKYVMVIACCGFSAAALIFTPELNGDSGLNFGPCLSFLAAGIGTLVWDSVDD